MLKRRLRKIKRIKRSLTSNTGKTLKYRKLSIDIERNSTKIINLVGYVILLLIVLDYGFLLITSQLFDPNWTYNAAGKLVENVWGLFLSLLLIFYRRDQDIVKPKESFILKVISWITLIAGISYFLLAPIILGNGFRVYRHVKAQLTNQINLQTTQVEQYTQQLQAANKEQLRSLLQAYNVSQNNAGITANSAEQIKNNLLLEIEQQQIQVKQQLENKFNQQKQNLGKKTIKWFLSSIISGVCFILIWQQTKWTRKTNRIRQKASIQS